MSYPDKKSNEFKLFAFIKEFKCFEEVKFCEETLNKELSIQKVEEWNKYWIRYGYELASKQWIQQEAQITVQTEDDSFEKERYFEVNKELPEDEHELNQDEIKSDILKESSNNPATLEENSCTGGLSKVWEEFFTNVYYDEYSNFSEVFDLYTFELFQSLISKPVDDVAEDYDFADLRFDYDQLKSLGLPTSFGIAAVPSRKKNKCNKKKTLFLDSLSESFSSDFSEEEEFFSCYSDMDSDDKASESPKKEEKSQEKLGKVHKNLIEKKKKKKKNRKLKNVPSFMIEDKQFLKYWRKRFSLFSLFDEGILLDKESWFSVTPEKIAIHIAERLACDTLIDGFCGCGGNTIQFAKVCNKVIAIDIDPEKIKMAKNNAKIYGVEEKIEFIVGDFLEICDKNEIKANVVFVSPPWGGPKYKLKQDYDIETDLLPISASNLIDKVRKISNNIGLFLPRNAKIPQVIKLAGIGNKCEIQHNYLDSRLVAITAFYGEDIINNKKDET